MPRSLSRRKTCYLLIFDNATARVGFVGLRPSAIPVDLVTAARRKLFRQNRFRCAARRATMSWQTQILYFTQS